jgi:hypothetical protein
MVDVAKYVITSNGPMKSYSIYAKTHTTFNKSDLPEDTINKYKKFLRQYKIENNNKIVILHFRSYQSNFSDNNQHFPRNVNPDTYRAMVNFLCDKGFWVLRIGDPSVCISVKHKKLYININNLLSCSI